MFSSIKAIRWTHAGRLYYNFLDLSHSLHSAVVVLFVRDRERERRNFHGTALGWIDRLDDIKEAIM